MYKRQDILERIAEESSEVKVLKANLLLGEGKEEEAEAILDSIADKDDLANIVDVSYMYIDMGFPEKALTWPVSYTHLRAIKFSEKMKAKAAGEDLAEVPIAYDALAVVVHPSNPVKPVSYTHLAASCGFPVTMPSMVVLPPFRCFCYGCRYPGPSAYSVPN